MILTWNLDQWPNFTRETKQHQKSVMMTSCLPIVTPLLFFQFMTNLEQWKTYIFFNSNLLSYKNWKQNWKIFSTTALTPLLWVKIPYLAKNGVFCKKCWHQQNWGGFGTKWYISWNCICVCTYVCTFLFVFLFLFCFLITIRHIKSISNTFSKWIIDTVWWTQ